MPRRVYSAHAVVLLLIGSLVLPFNIQLGMAFESSSVNRELPSGRSGIETSENRSLVQAMQTIEESVNWEKAVYAGVLFRNKTRIDLENLIDGYSAVGDWLSVLRWSSICRKLGIERETAIKAALDGLPMVGPLPWTGDYGGNSYFCVEQKFALFGYYYAEKYDYRLDKWNKTSGYSFLSTSISSVGRPVLFIGALGNTWTIVYGPRYYDEAASTVQCFLVFYQLGIVDAISDALYWWKWINSNLWFRDNHYQYAMSWADYECEAGFFDKIVANLKYYEPNLENWPRILDDATNRFLSDRWNSPQWLTTHGTTYVVIHHYPSNSQRRLKNTIGAWTTLLSLCMELDVMSKDALQNLLMGYDGLEPAWKLLMSSAAGLYDPNTNKFKWLSATPVSDEATAYALTLLFFMGIVPKTTALAFPIEEYEYEYIFDIDPELYGICLENKTISISVAGCGGVEFIYGDSPVQCSFPSSGTYEIVFSDDWNSIISISRLGDLPSNRKFLQIPLPPEHNISVINVTLSGDLAEPTSTVTINVTTQNKGNFAENFNLTIYANSTLIASQNVTLQSGAFDTSSCEWNTTGFVHGSYWISAYAEPVFDEMNTSDNLFIGGTIYVGILGDVNHDGAVDLIDIGHVARRFGTDPSKPTWDSRFDLNNDGRVDLQDIGIVARHFGQSCP